MTRQEELILLIVSLLLLAKVGLVIEELLIAYWYGTGAIPLHDKHQIDAGKEILSGFVNIGAAAWLFIEARAAALRSWIWALFGLFFGLLGVAVFYLAMLYTRHKPTV